ncbi:SUPT7L family protein [Megaselia abdita]
MIKWGSFDLEADDRELKISEVVSSQSKEELIDDITVRSPDEPKKIRVQIKNCIVTQTVEALYQSEMLDKLIKKGTSRSSDDNKLITTTKKPLPKIIFPPEITAELHMPRRNCAPLNFIVPKKTDFTSGKPLNFTTLSREVQKTVLKKSICGMLRAVGFKDATENSVLMLTDVVDDFLKKFMIHIQDTKASESSERIPRIKIKTLEKAYFSYQNTSLITLSKHMKHFGVEQNQQAKKVFQESLRNYNKARRETDETYKGMDDLKLAFDMNQQFPGSFEEFLENPPSKTNSFATDLACDFQDVIAERLLDKKERSSGAVVGINIIGSTQPIYYPLDKYVEIISESPTKDKKEKKFVKYCLNVKEGYDLSAVDPFDTFEDADPCNGEEIKEVYREGFKQFMSE